MILEVRGNIEGLQDTDNMKRTPAHLAAICGQGEVVNFLLDRGGWYIYPEGLLILRDAAIFAQFGFRLHAIT